MYQLIGDVCRYLAIVLMLFYTMICFTAFNRRSERSRSSVMNLQVMILFLLHLVLNLSLYAVEQDIAHVFYYLVQVVFVIATLLLYRTIYEGASRLIINNMCMLLVIGFAVLERLNFNESIRQFTIVTISMLLSLLIPAMIAKWQFLRRISWIYAIVGIVPLLVVLVRSRLVFGAKITLDLGFFSVQPSEFVKVVFVFFVAAILSKRPRFRTVVWTTVISAVYVVILVLSTDLGAALLFFITYLVMLYVGSGRAIYGLAGLAAGAGGGFVGAKLFPHVQNRIMAWKSPFEHYQDVGNQVSNSLIAIAVGGWFGVGLGRGYPTLVPLADKDFTFAAIAEELGGIFGICLILVYMSCFVMFINISVQIKHRFYKLVALGLSTMYGFQVFLTIGGAIKLIPSTGVTLPLISYGGSSILMMIILFAIIQGIYVLKLEGEEEDYAAIDRFTTEYEYPARYEYTEDDEDEETY